MANIEIAAKVEKNTTLKTQIEQHELVKPDPISEHVSIFCFINDTRNVT